VNTPDDHAGNSAKEILRVAGLELKRPYKIHSLPSADTRSQLNP
jgi:hypothetical protein